jgi:glycosyltransferase involved in cell wall biosynthesis
VGLRVGGHFEKQVAAGPEAKGIRQREGASVTSAPTVSVITISFHDLDGLRRTVDSVRAQRYGGSIEHIVIDGGSGDEVVEYLAGREPAFTYWQSAPDGGRYDAMNQGIAHASGDLLCFLNSGDRFSDPEAVAQVVEAIAGHGSVREAWGYGLQHLIGPDGRSFGNLRAPMPFSFHKFLGLGMPVPHQAALFGSSLVRELGGYDVDFGLGADQLFIFRAALLREPITIQRVMCDCDATGASALVPLSEHFRDRRRMCDLQGHYLLGGRRTSLAYMRGWEYLLRAAASTVRSLRRQLGGEGVVDVARRSQQAGRISETTAGSSQG